MGYPMFFLVHYLAIWSHLALDGLAKSVEIIMRLNCGGCQQGLMPSAPWCLR